jgi:bleomycin hydrolase
MQRLGTIFRAHIRFSLLLLGALLTAPALGQTNRSNIFQALEKLPHPINADDFPLPSHFPCLNQGETSICWSYATSSFLESEMARLHLPSVRLSVMYPPYCQFLEKARRFVQTKGESRFDPGDLFTGVPEAFLKYGALPASAYDKQTDKKLPDQSRLYAELQKLMADTRRKGQWDESRVLGKVQHILNRYLGKPPEKFSFDGKTYTRKSFVDEVVKLPWSDYVLLTSFKNAPFNTFTEFKVPDNWHHNTNYFNLPLPVFYDAFKHALQNGYSVAVSIDTSEPSYRVTGRYCFIPATALSDSGITQELREQQFMSGATTDDHAIHILGYRNTGGEDWFLAMDSWRTTWRDGNHGCLFLHESYVKMKILAFIVHRDGVAPIIAGAYPGITAK